MGRRTKLLKPRSWGAADIRLFFISLSVSLSPSTVFYPHFMVPYSVCLRLYPSSVLLLTPALVLLAVLSLLLLILFLFCSLLSTSASHSYSSLQRKTSGVLQSQSGCAERICIIFSPEIICSRHPLLPPLCDDYLTVLLHLKRKTGHLSKPREEKAILVTAEEAPFTESRGDVKNVLSGSEIDGGESLSFWHSSSDRFSPWEAVAAEAQLQLLSFVSGCFRICCMRRRGNKIQKWRSRFKCPSDMPWIPWLTWRPLSPLQNQLQQGLCRVKNQR